MEIREELLRRIAAELCGERRRQGRGIESAWARDAGRGGPELAGKGERIAGRHLREPEPDGSDDDRFHRLSAVADRLEQIGRTVDSLPDSLSLRTLEERLRTLAIAVEHLVRRPPDFGSATFAQIEFRLDEISRAIVACSARPARVDPEPFQRIEARIAALARQIEAIAGEPPAAEIVETIGALSERIDEMARQMEWRLDDLAGRLAGLDAIEKCLADSREDVLAAARHAAEKAVLSLAGSQAPETSLAALADALEALEALARRSDERNSRTFDAIHDTLLRIVDRLESGRGDAGPDGSLGHLAHEVVPVPPGQAVSPLSTDMVGWQVEAAAGKPLDAAVVPPIGQRRSVRSTLGGLLSGRREHSAPRPHGAEAEGPRAAMTAGPPESPDAPLDPGIGSRPLRLGSRAPDADAGRVRGLHARPAPAADADAAGSDVIAAARRAARAAAAEAEVLERTGVAARSAARP